MQKSCILLFLCYTLVQGGQINLKNQDHGSKAGKSTRFIFDGRYYEVSAVGLNWHSARHACKELGMELVSIESPEENLAILQEISSDDANFWISGSDLGEEGNFIWDTTGKAIEHGYQYWENGEPQNGPLNGEHCVKLRSKFYHHWSDEKCEDVERFICEQIVQC